MNLPNSGPILLTLLLAQTAPLLAEELFRQPASPTPFPDEMEKSCLELEREMAQLTPLTYSYKPGFYENSYQGAAVLAGTLSTPVFYLYPAFDYFLDYRENSRILPVQDKLERLRHLKAEKHCFES
ncbi:MAG: hypothetical protein H6964_02630 [Chromatiaceae bacterium]|nr:hypothetical protein [Gammaproteobacteria bacterium]MCP5427855.1 hypothetical protein [Chromatiaceae bacterium]MCB1862353.1 hypothetical protein [Gammaproteobacteria bacterium]MCB1874213.1 hypothetical protein [Gammaproteobacteria bacterium]MCB1881312.1 hypothetical protein [Gammaproteobacteria bacterium]